MSGTRRRSLAKFWMACSGSGSSITSRSSGTKAARSSPGPTTGSSMSLAGTSGAITRFAAWNGNGIWTCSA